MTIRRRFERFICNNIGHAPLLVDYIQSMATCQRCGQLFSVDIDFTFGGKVPPGFVDPTIRIEPPITAKRLVDCGNYNCEVVKTYGFVLEAGCPIHDP
jgi:hypothetical protein